MQIVVPIESEIDVLNSVVLDGFNILCSARPEISFPYETMESVSLKLL